MPNAVVNQSVQLPVEYSDLIIRGVLGRSKALELGRRLPDMRGKEYKLNVNKVLPVAGWVKNSQSTPNSEGTEINRKPISTYAFEGVTLEAEELAVIIPISENTLEDVENFDIPLMQEISEQAIGAFQQVIDASVFFGVDAPWTGWNGLVADAATKGKVVAWDGQAGTGFYHAISAAMKYVEKSGYRPNAILGGPSLSSAFRDSITTLGVNVTDQGEIGNLARHEDYTGGFDTTTAFAIVGDFSYLVYSFRKEMTMKLLTEGVIQDVNTGAILYNLSQQDMIALRFVMRLGFALPNPVNRVGGANRYPFAVITNSAEGSY